MSVENTTNLAVANPYVGPRTFTYAQRRLFFGRDREARDLLARVVSERVLLFYAQSGAGKSSLLHTRLIPQLREEEGFAVLPVGRVSGELPAGVGRVENIYLFNLMASLDQSNVNPARLARLTLCDFLARLTSGDGERWRYIDPADDPEQMPITDAAGVAPMTNGSYAEQRYALLIDQFEEIITTHPDHWREREGFFRQLNQALLADPNLWVVLTLREDYVAALDPYAQWMADKLRARFYMERMGVAAALEAVKRPAALARRPFVEGVAEALVDNLRRIKLVGQAEEQLGQYIEPVQLQVVCYQLWEKLKHHSLRSITIADLWQAGDVDRALAGFYEEALATVLKQAIINVTEGQLRLWFDEHLITEASTRGTVYQGIYETAGMSNQVAQLLVKQFLLRTELRSGGAWIELVHDRFIEPIRQSNQEWLNRQSPLVRAARNWEDAGRNPELLLSDHQVEIAQREVASNKPDPLFAEYLLASSEAAKVRAERIMARQREVELKQAQTLAREAEARRQAESQRAAEAEARQREQAHAATQLRKRALLLSAVSVLAAILMAAAIWFGIRAVTNARAMERAFQEAQRASEHAAIAQFQAEAAATEAALAKAAAEQERNSALQLAANLQILLQTPTPATSPLQPTNTFAPVGLTLVLVPTTTPTPNLAATATIQAVVAEINEVQARATQAAQPPIQSSTTEAMLYALAPDIDVSIFAEADIAAQVLAKVRSPLRLPVQEISPEWAKVETNDGVVGWIRTPFFTYEGNREVVPLELRYRLVSDRTDLPFIYAQVISYNGAEGDYLLRDPNNEQSGFRWIPVGWAVTVLQIGSGTSTYGSGIWYFVVLVDPNDETEIRQGWLAREVLGPATSDLVNQTPVQSMGTVSSPSVVLDPSTVGAEPLNTPEILMIEDFEGVNLMNFKINLHALRQGNTGSLYLVSQSDVNISQSQVNYGESVLAFDFEVLTNDPPYIGFGRTHSIGQDWSDYSELCFWMKTEDLSISDRSGIQIQIGISDNAVARYEIPKSYYIDPDSDTHCVSLNDARWSTPENKGNLTAIAHYAIYTGGSVNDRGRIYIDNIYLK